MTVRLADPRRMPTLFHGSRFWIEASEAERMLAALPLRAPPEWSRFRTAQQVSESTITNAFRACLTSGDAVYLKRYVYRRPQWRYLLRHSKALREARGTSAMGRVGVASAEVLAFGEWRQFGLLRAAFLVTRELPDTVDLREWAVHQAPGLPRPQLERIARQLGGAVVDEVRRLHRAGLAHRDLKWRNILVREEAGRWRCWFIDCPRFTGSRFMRRRSQQLDLSGLARGAVLYLPLRARLRLLLRYVDGDKYEARRILRWVEAHLARRPPRHKPFVTKDRTRGLTGPASGP
ncbi:MAG: lipopolysaccharide kinase InaA family protein [Pseudomonadota bacterium]|nr:lipopolysaccharide kinase InaA family protein [Pseudomonadota bacterium]